MPLHGDKGGPLFCRLCAGARHAEHGRRHKAGRVVIKAMNAYLEAGGRWIDFDKLKILTWRRAGTPRTRTGDVWGAEAPAAEAAE
jgi:hypothetical protein